MRHIGLTGNVAAGKSAVAALFRRWGATVIDADEIVHQLQEPGTAVLAAITARFGAGILRPDGSLDRARLRAVVLTDEAARRDLEAIVHPAVQARRQALLAEARRRGDPLVVSDIPLLFETMDPAGFDAVVLVDAPAAVRRDRLVAQRRLSPDEAERLIAAQAPADAKRDRSTFVIDNDGDEATLERRARKVWEAIFAA
jgi:dephospho-CoA kinase